MFDYSLENNNKKQIVIVSAVVVVAVVAVVVWSVRVCVSVCGLPFRICNVRVLLLE